MPQQKRTVRKVSRSLKLDEHIDQALVRICELRGVTPNSWLLNVIGDAVYKAQAQERMEQATSQSTENMLASMVKMFGELPEEEEK